MDINKPILDYLLEQGPSKAAVIASAVHASETTVRKCLKDLEAKDLVNKNGQQYELVVQKKRKRDDGASGPRARDARIAERDGIVRTILVTKASCEGEYLMRNDIVAALVEAGHDWPPSYVYLSLHRLRSAGMIETVHVGQRAPGWRVVDGAAA